MVLILRIRIILVQVLHIEDNLEHGVIQMVELISHHNGLHYFSGHNQLLLDLREEVQLLA